MNTEHADSDFWQNYSKDEEQFDECVHQGIYISYDLEYVQGDGVKSEYNGVSASKLRRHYKCWKENQDKFIKERPLHFTKAMFAFGKDYEEDLKTAEVELVLKEISNLPMPPEGYYWASDNGGIRFRNTMSYRLWHGKLGYMCRSE